MSEQNNELNFDLEPIEVPVVIFGKRYVLLEASGDADAKYQNALLRSTKIGPDGKPCGMDGMADAEPLLVSQCLFTAGPDGGVPLNNQGLPDKRHLVTEHQIRQWPARIKRSLFAKIKEISGMNDGEGGDSNSKNVQNSQGGQKLPNDGTDGCNSLTGQGSNFINALDGAGQ